MDTKVNYALVGIFVTTLVAAIIIVVLWLSSGLQTQQYKIYQVYMNESVSGLSENAPVKFNGVDVGSVESIELNLKNPQQVVLTLKIKPDVPITKATTAVLSEQGITGIAFIGLKAGKPAPILKAKPGQKYPVIPSSPSFLVRLDQTIENLSNSFNDMSKHVKNLLSEENVKSVQTSLKNIEKISDAIASNDENISQSLKDLRIVLSNTAQASKRFPEIMTAITRGSKSIENLSKELSITSKNVNKTVLQGDIAIQSFSNSILPTTYDAMNNIKNITENLQGLSAELSENPAILIKGKKPAKPGPGE